MSKRDGHVKQALEHCHDCKLKTFAFGNLYCGLYQSWTTEFQGCYRWTDDKSVKPPRNYGAAKARLMTR